MKNKNLSEEKLRILPHILENWNKRNIDINIIYQSVTNKKYLGILKTRENRFQLFYEYPPNEKNEDLILVIEIDDYENIKVVTTFTSKITKRIREYEIR
ncbi:MAG: hypothetical protein ACRC1M_06505 [Methanobacteriaceae archaeon]